jgi:hypothetical protein
MHYLTDSIDRAKLSEAKDSIDKVIESKREQLGLENVLPLNMSKDNALKLCTTIKSDSVWKEGFYEVINSIAPELASVDTSALLNAVTIPWWNVSVLGRVGDKYDAANNELSIDASISHSYITQLNRSPSVREIASSLKKSIPNSAEAMSISNVLVTKDNLIILGIRSGNSYANTLMITPAGSVEYHSGENPVFETIYAEHFEELGLAKEQLKEVSLIGRIHDVSARCSLYVSRSKTDMMFQELLSMWNSAVDNREHKFLVPVRDHPQDVMNLVLAHGYDSAKENLTSVSLTTTENVNTILPPAIGSLLVHYAQREGIAWGRKAQDMLNNMYMFR